MVSNISSRSSNKSKHVLDIILDKQIFRSVMQKTIDSYGSISPPRFPQRLITITFTPGDDTEPQLRHPITFTGIKSDTKQLNIVLTIGKKLALYIMQLLLTQNR